MVFVAWSCGGLDFYKVVVSMVLLLGNKCVKKKRNLLYSPTLKKVANMLSSVSLFSADPSSTYEHSKWGVQLCPHSKDFSLTRSLGFGFS